MNTSGVVSVTINDEGSGYISTPDITLVGAVGCTPGTVTLDKGRVTAIAVTGTCTKIPTSIVIAEPMITATATTSSPTNDIFTVNFTNNNKGAGYITAPQVAVSGGKCALTPTARVTLEK